MHSNRPNPGHSRLRAMLLGLALLLAPLLGLAQRVLAAPSCATSGTTVTCTFSYTGAPETWIVPVGVTQATFDLYGAQGGMGGLGGRVTATLAVTPGASHQIWVGGQNGFNGGGVGASGITGSGGGGGGGTDVRTGSFALQERILIAGGGGGGSGSGAGGGAGGYPTGGAGSSVQGPGFVATGGEGGTQDGGGQGGLFGGQTGSLGQGGDGTTGPDQTSGGGGGGYYGGGGGGGGLGVSAGGGGGSSYGPNNASFENGVRESNGQVIISYTITDTTAPMASPTLSPAANANGWNNSDVTVSWNWVENNGGEGIDPANCTTSSSTSGQGEQTLSATCKDQAGNVGSASSLVKVDTSAPTISAAATTAPNASGWYTGDVSVAFTCNDTIAGVASCPANQTLSAEGSSVSSTALAATDMAGNTSAPSPIITVKIDRTPPSTIPDSVNLSGSGATLTFAASDNLSGVASTSYRVDGGAAQPYTGPFTISGPGTRIVSYFSTDVAGNREAERSTTFTFATPTSTPISTPTATATPSRGALFPSTHVLDSFDRANGTVGSTWEGLTGSTFYRISSNQLDVQAGGPLVWKATTFGASQEAFARLKTIDAKSPSQGVLLKMQSGSIPDSGAISVIYDAVAKAVRVSTLRLGQNGVWTPYANQAATFANGDVLGARAKADGTVQIYKNGTLVTTVTLNAADQAFFNGKGGKIGIWTAAAPNALLDDFGGGTAAL